MLQIFRGISEYPLYSYWDWVVNDISEWKELIELVGRQGYNMYLSASSSFAPFLAICADSLSFVPTIVLG